MLLFDAEFGSLITHIYEFCRHSPVDRDMRSQFKLQIFETNISLVVYSQQTSGKKFESKKEMPCKAFSLKSIVRS